MKDCIQDFVDSWHKYDAGNESLSWPDRFDDAGYYRAEWGSGTWGQIHEWCKEKFGPRHYAWAGSTFWFETEQDAIMFILKWS